MRPAMPPAFASSMRLAVAGHEDMVLPAALLVGVLVVVVVLDAGPAPWC